MLGNKTRKWLSPWVPWFSWHGIGLRTFQHRWPQIVEPSLHCKHQTELQASHCWHLAKGMHFGLLTSTKKTMPKYIFRFHMQKDGNCWPLPRYRVRMDNFLAPSPRQAFIFRSFFRPLVLSSLWHQQKSESKSKQPGSDQAPQNSQTRVPLALLLSMIPRRSPLENAPEDWSCRHLKSMAVERFKRLQKLNFRYLANAIERETWLQTTIPFTIAVASPSEAFATAKRWMLVASCWTKSLRFTKA